MNNRYMSQMNDYLEGGQGSAPRQNGAFANMVPRRAQLMDQPHMLAYINPAEEQMLRDMGGAGIPGPDGIPVYGIFGFDSVGDMFDGGGRGASGDTYSGGGVISSVGNAVTGGGYTGNSGSSEDMDRAAMNARNAAAAAAAAAAALPTYYYDSAGSSHPTQAAANASDISIARAATEAELASTGPAATKGLYENLTGTKFEDTLVGGALGVTSDSTFGSEGSADDLYTSGVDLVDGGGAGASGDTFVGDGALSNIVAGTANTLGVTPYNEDASLFGSGGALDVITDVTDPTKIITNKLTGGVGVLGTIGNIVGGALDNTAVGELLLNNKWTANLANSMGITNLTAADLKGEVIVQNPDTKAIETYTSINEVPASYMLGGDTATEYTLASNEGSSYSGDTGLITGADGNTLEVGANVNINDFIDPNTNQEYEVLGNLNTDQPSSEITSSDDDPATSGAVRADIMGAEMGDYIRKYKGGSGAYLPSYMQRYMSGETIDDMFRQFTGEDGKQYYITPTGEVYDADAFIGAATGDTSRLQTGNEIVVGYTETDASGNVTSYNNDGTPL